MSKISKKALDLFRENIDLLNENNDLTRLHNSKNYVITKTTLSDIIKLCKKCKHFIYAEYGVNIVSIEECVVKSRKFIILISVCEFEIALLGTKH